MLNCLTKTIDRNLSLSCICQLISQHEHYFLNGVGLNIDIHQADYVDPSAVAIIVQFKKRHPGLIELVNPNGKAKKLIEKVEGIRNPGTILPALPVFDFLGLETLEHIKLWLRTTLGRYFSVKKDVTSSPIMLTAVELINNVIDHAQSPLGGTVSGASYSTRKHIELTVVDLGATIPGTLAPLYPGLSDHELIAKALEFGVSRRKGLEHNYGRGLDTVKSYALQDPGCSLVIISRDGFVSISNAELPHCRPGRYAFNGTVIKCNFSENFINQIIKDAEPESDMEV